MTLILFLLGLVVVITWGTRSPLGLLVGGWLIIMSIVGVLASAVGL